MNFISQTKQNKTKPKRERERECVRDPKIKCIKIQTAKPDVGGSIECVLGVHHNTKQANEQRRAKTLSTTYCIYTTTKKIGVDRS